MFELPPADFSANYYARIHAALLSHPTAETLTWPSVTPTDSSARYSAADVLAQVSRARRYLRAQGVMPGQRVLVAVPVGPALVAALLALLALGAVAVLPPAGASWLTRLRLPGQAGATAAVVSSRPRLSRRWLARRLGLRLLIVPGDVRPAQAAQGAASIPLPPAWTPVFVPPDQPALVSHSSGSTTGRPKPIVRTHAVLGAQHTALRAAFPPWAGQRDLPLFPNILLHNLALPEGVSSVLPAVPWRYLPGFDPARVAAQLVTERIETLTGNVTYYRRLLPALRNLPAGALAGVRAAGIGGSPVPEPLVQELRTVFASADVFIIYGSSEAEPIAVRCLDTAPAADPRCGYCVGQPAAGIALDFTSTDLTLTLPDGRAQPVGEVRVRGAHVAQPAGAELDAWLATGDFGYLGVNGELWLTARRGNAGVMGGCQHYPLEHVAQHVPGVGRVAARPTPAGFAVWVEGADPALVPAVRRALEAAFPALRQRLTVQLRARLPVDARHHAKIRYDRLG